MFLQPSRWLLDIPWTCVVLYLVGLYVLTAVLRPYLRLRLLPPGPRRYPIVGNALQVPRTHLFLKCREWAEQYGPQLLLLSITNVYPEV